MYGQPNVRRRNPSMAGNSPIPNQSLGGTRRSMMTGHRNQSPHPTHMSNHPPVTPYAPFRAPFGSMSPSPFTSPFVARLATPFKNYSRRFSRAYSSHGYPPASGGFSSPSEETLDLQAAFVVYVCGLIIALFLFWFSTTLQNRFFTFIFWFASILVALFAIAGIVSDVYTWMILPKLHEIQSYIRSFKFASLFPFLVAPQAPIGVINTPPRRQHGGRISRGSPTKIGGGRTARGQTGDAGGGGGGASGNGSSHRHEAYSRPHAAGRDNFFSPNRVRNDVIIKDPYGHRAQESATGTHAPSSTSKGFLGGVGAFLWGDSPRPSDTRATTGPPRPDLHPNVTATRGSRPSGGVSKAPRSGTPIGSAFAVNFSPIPAKTGPNNFVSPWGNGTGASKLFSRKSKLFSPMSLDSAQVNTSMTSNFSFIGIGGPDTQMEPQAPFHHRQNYSASAPLSPRHRDRSGGFGLGYSQSMNATGFYDSNRGVLQPTMRAQNEMASRFDGGGLAQRYGASYRHPTEHKKKRASLDEHVSSSVELYRALGIDDKMHNWAEQIRWWLLNKVIKAHTEDWRVNDVNVNELFRFLCNKFPQNQGELANFHTATKRGEFFLANVQQMTQLAHSFKSPEIIEIIQKRQYIVNAMKKIGGSSRHLDYLQERLRFLSNCTNPAEVRWNGGGAGWESGQLPTDCQLMMSIFGQFMDDYLCPAFEFTGKYLIKCDLFPHEDEMDDMVRKHCRGGFEDVAIVEVGHHAFGDDKLVGPYYFVIFDKKKHRIAEERAARQIERQQHRSSRRSSSSSSQKYGAWYPQPGGSNMIHALTLFSFFIHDFMGDQIANRNLMDQDMFVNCVR